MTSLQAFPARKGDIPVARFRSEVAGTSSFRTSLRHASNVGTRTSDTSRPFDAGWAAALVR